MYLYLNNNKNLYTESDRKSSSSESCRSPKLKNNNYLNKQSEKYAKKQRSRSRSNDNIKNPMYTLQEFIKALNIFLANSIGVPNIQYQLAQLIQRHQKVLKQIEDLTQEKQQISASINVLTKSLNLPKQYLLDKQQKQIYNIQNLEFHQEESPVQVPLDNSQGENESNKQKQIFEDYIPHQYLTQNKKYPSSKDQNNFINQTFNNYSQFKKSKYQENQQAFLKENLARKQIKTNKQEDENDNQHIFKDEIQKFNTNVNEQILNNQQQFSLNNENSYLNQKQDSSQNINNKITSNIQEILELQEDCQINDTPKIHIRGTKNLYPKYYLRSNDKNLSIYTQKQDQIQYKNKQSNIYVSPMLTITQKQQQQQGQQQLNYKNNILFPNTKMIAEEDSISIYDRSCLLIGVPLDFKISDIIYELQKNQIEAPEKIENMNENGLDYIQLSFKNQLNSEQLILKQPPIKDTPILYLPYMEDCKPIQMLFNHQLIVQVAPNTIDHIDLYHILIQYGQLIEIHQVQQGLFVITFISQELASKFNDQDLIIDYNSYQIKLTFQNVEITFPITRKTQSTTIHAIYQKRIKGKENYEFKDTSDHTSREQQVKQTKLYYKNLHENTKDIKLQNNFGKNLAYEEIIYNPQGQFSIDNFHYDIDQLEDDKKDNQKCQDIEKTPQKLIYKDEQCESNDNI